MSKAEEFSIFRKVCQKKNSICMYFTLLKDHFYMDFILSAPLKLIHKTDKSRVPPSWMWPVVNPAYLHWNPRSVTLVCPVLGVTLTYWITHSVSNSSVNVIFVMLESWGLLHHLGGMQCHHQLNPWLLQSDHSPQWEMLQPSRLSISTQIGIIYVSAKKAPRYWIKLKK